MCSGGLQNNPEIQEWMAQQDPEICSMPALEQHFERRVLDLAAAAGRSYIVWQEILDNNVQVRASGGNERYSQLRSSSGRRGGLLFKRAPCAHET